ncbi:MAG TPA: PD-(D/E)XK nuclease family protein [Methylomirabilota bacterium]|nr:PD-(D/E)XK nuclease family protein [Methylomirabilota bacterium]
MRARFLLGPAGSGKTHRCLAEIRAALTDLSATKPLVLLAPKQATFQWERQLLAEPSLPGYTRLHILSFERLAAFIFESLQVPVPELLGEDGRVMVLRALLAEHQDRLKLFRGSALAPGFALQLSRQIRELQHHQASPALLDELAARAGPHGSLGRKLHDFALLLRAYRDWLRRHQLRDADSLLDGAVEVLKTAASPCRDGETAFRLDGLWLDGFAQLTPQELRLLAEVVPRSGRATLAFCLDPESPADPAWHSPWAVISRTVRQCQDALAAVPGVEVEVECLARNEGAGRFATAPALQHLERHWAAPRPGVSNESGHRTAAVRVVACPHPEAEAQFAAREIVRFVRAGGRYRDVAVLVRQLDLYHDPIRRVFGRYEIPLFLDRREPVAHHPLAELTRCALRTVAFGWRHEDWFGALKSGLVHPAAAVIDHLENEALARGWEGKTWQTPLSLSADAATARELEALRVKIVPAFRRLGQVLAGAPSGRALARGLRDFWAALGVEETLTQWSRPAEGVGESEFAPLHETVWGQMQTWLDHLALAFAEESLPVSRWLPILDAGLSGLTVGVIPPALDQVLVGAIDRSRNPDLRRAYVLGVNETVFPGPVSTQSLLTTQEREQLERLGRPLGPDARLEMGHERFYGYVACTRAREQVVLTYALRSAEGRVLNPSPFVSHVRRLLPDLALEEFRGPGNWWETEHVCEAAGPLFEAMASPHTSRGPEGDILAFLRGQSSRAAMLDRFERLRSLGSETGLRPEQARRLYGRTLQTSVSRLEQFAACPFRFFVNSGLHAEERQRLEFDLRERGSFQHEVLAAFHERIVAEGRRWRDLGVEEAAERIGALCDELAPRFNDGLLLASPENRFAIGAHKRALQRVIRTLVEWMAQYDFDPAVVEIAFGREGPLPALELELDAETRLSLQGRIDRVDLYRPGGSEDALAVVIDYKSGFRRLERRRIESGLQQQLPAYLCVLRRLDEKTARSVFGAPRLRPVGVFYVNLRGRVEPAGHRGEARGDVPRARRRAYQHEGLFDFSALRHLDRREGAKTGDQFKYRLRKDGEPYANDAGVLRSGELEELLDRCEETWRSLGRRILRGEAAVDPYRKGHEVACGSCAYQGICRIDPWTHVFRVLDGRDATEAED